MAMIVSIECPSCATAFPVDPDKVPQGGARTECTVCATPFAVDPASWGGEGATVEAWHPSEAEASEVVQEDSDVAVEEFAPVDEAWAPGADSELEAPFGDDMVTDESEGFSEFGAEGSFEGAVLEEESIEAAESVEAVESFDAVETVEVVESFDAVEAVEAVESVDAVEPAEDVQATQDFETNEGFETPDDFESVGVELQDAEPEEAVSSGFDVSESGFTETAADEIAPGDDSGAEPVIELETATEPEGSTADFDSDDESASGGFPQTGELVTDQWADLVDGDAEDGAEVTSDWSGEDGAWVVETEDGMGVEIGEIEVERLDTVEEHVRAAQDDPDLTEPAEGVDTNELSGGADGFGDFMTGEETMLPADALEAGGPGLHLDEENSGVSDFVVEEAALEVEPEVPEVVVEGVAEEETTTFQFGRRDPHDKARRLARVLVSDMITYNPDRHVQALQNDSVKSDFEEEIEKSWAEYVEQVGPEIAESTDYWRDALNEILAGDEALF